MGGCCVKNEHEAWDPPLKIGGVRCFSVGGKTHLASQTSAMRLKTKPGENEAQNDNQTAKETRRREPWLRGETLDFCWGLWVGCLGFGGNQEAAQLPPSQQKGAFMERKGPLNDFGLQDFEGPLGPRCLTVLGVLTNWGPPKHDFDFTPKGFP